MSEIERRHSSHDITHDHDRRRVSQVASNKSVMYSHDPYGHPTKLHVGNKKPARSGHVAPSFDHHQFWYECVIIEVPLRAGIDGSFEVVTLAMTRK